jgi:hypothetical protein
MASFSPPVGAACKLRCPPYGGRDFPVMAPFGATIALSSGCEATPMFRLANLASSEAIKATNIDEVKYAFGMFP